MDCTKHFSLTKLQIRIEYSLLLIFLLLIVMIDKPKNYNLDLTDERIILLAEFFALVRGEVIDRHDEETLGDTRLGLGMRAYECCRSRLISQSETGVWPWLSILTPEKRFTFCIGNIPVRFVRNSPESLPNKKLIRSDEAVEQLDLFSDDLPQSPIHWFLVIDTYYLNAADSIYFIGYSDANEIICKWEVPLQDTVTLMSDVNSTLPQAVEVKEAPLGIRKKVTIKKPENE